MKQFKYILLGALILALGATAGAQAKLGFVDSNRAVVSTDEGKAEYQKIADWAQKQDGSLGELRKQIEEKQVQLRNQANILTDDKKEELAKDLDRLETEFKRRGEDLKREYARRLDEFGKKMDKKITPLFNKFAQDNGYTMILYLNPQIVAYYDPNIDVTDQIIKLYNQAYPFTPQQ
jgi:outer membrane protein